jgi:hypothetical protein
VRRMRWNTTGSDTASAPSKKNGARKLMSGRRESPTSLRGTASQNAALRSRARSICACQDRRICDCIPPLDRVRG